MLTNCNTCGKEINRKPCYVKNNKKCFCSKECQNKGQITSISCNCDKCGKSITVLASIVKRSKHGHNFCSKSCACSFNNTAFRSNKNNPNWKGSDYVKIAFNTYISECTICGYNNIDALQVHHLDKNRKNSAADNLMILCANHHSILHKGKLEITEEIKQSRKLLQLDTL